MTEMHHSPVVRAIDVGYGNTKFVVSHRPDRSLECGIFPSLAPQASGGPDLSSGIFAKRNTVTVTVDGVTYEVGKDSRLAQDASYGRTLDADFCKTNAYKALVRGALYYVGAAEIDLLVLGLPVNLFETHHQYLEQAIVGNHDVPLPNGEPAFVHVHAVRVIPQPIGGFFDHALKNGLYQKMKAQMNLLIDPGFYTLDWVVAEGVKMVNSRSGAHSGGMSAVLSAIGDSVSKELGTQVVDYRGIDDALRLRTKARFFGREHDISKHVKLGEEKARQFVSVLANKVGRQGQDIDNIILVGGGAQFFCPLVQEKFPLHELIIADGSVFANVRGFQLAGEQMVRTLGLARGEGIA